MLSPSVPKVFFKTRAVTFKMSVDLMRFPNLRVQEKPPSGRQLKAGYQPSATAESDG